PFAELLAHMDEFRRAASAPDPDALSRLLPADFTMRGNRRFASTERPLSRDQYVASAVVLRQMGVRARTRLDPLPPPPRSVIADVTIGGTREGGDFELTSVAVFQHDGRRVHVMEAFDTDQLDTAFARYEELSREPATPPRIENAATRSEDAVGRAWEGREWEALRSLFSPEYRSVDRRSLMRVETDRDGMLSSLRPVFAMGVARSGDLLATRRNRLALD